MSKCSDPPGSPSIHLACIQWPTELISLLTCCDLTRNNLSEEGLLLAYSWGTGVHCGWGVCGGGLATVVLQSGSRAQTSSEASLRAFLQWLTSSRDVHFLRRPHTFKIAALIEDQVFKHKACQRTFHIKPQQWLKALAWFLNNPWIFAFSRLTQLVQSLLIYGLVTVCSRPLFVSVYASHLVSRRAAREESLRASQGSVIFRFKLVMAQAAYPLVLTYVPMPFLVPGTPCTAPTAQARCCFCWLGNILTILFFKSILHCG